MITIIITLEKIEGRIRKILKMDLSELYVSFKKNSEDGEKIRSLLGSEEFNSQLLGFFSR